jgi:hypothetical protein
MLPSLLPHFLHSFIGAVVDDGRMMILRIEERVLPFIPVGIEDV